MSAVTFFAMHGAMKILDAYEKIEACDIAYITICTNEWYERVREKYSSVIEDKRIEQTVPVDSAVLQNPGLDGEDAKNFMMGLFAAKRGMA